MSINWAYVNIFQPQLSMRKPMAVQVINLGKHKEGMKN